LHDLEKVFSVSEHGYAKLTTLPLVIGCTVHNAFENVLIN